MYIYISVKHALIRAIFIGKSKSILYKVSFLQYTLRSLSTCETLAVRIHLSLKYKHEKMGKSYKVPKEEISILENC